MGIFVRAYLSNCMVFIEDLKRIRSFFFGGKITLVDVNQASQIGQMAKQNGH